MRIYKAIVLNGLMYQEIYQADIEDDHWIAVGIQRAKSLNTPFFVMHNAVNLDHFESHIYFTDLTYANILQNVIVSTLLMIGVVHGQTNKCEQLLNQVYNVNEELSKNNSFNKAGTINEQKRNESSLGHD